MTRSAAPGRAKGLIGLVAGVSLVAALALPAVAATEHCPDGGTKTEANGGTQAAINALVLEAGTQVCVKAENEATGLVTADGSTTLQAYLYAAGIVDGSGQQGRDVSYYVVYGTAPSTDPSPTDDDDDDAALNIRKVNEQGRRLAGAIFTVGGMEGTFTTNDRGFFCITGLEKDSVWLVTEIQAPAGYEIADEPSRMVEVDNDGDCDSADAIFVNALAAEEPSQEPSEAPSEEPTVSSPTPTPREDTQGGNPTPAPGGGTVPDTAMGHSSAPVGLAWLIALASLSLLIGVQVAEGRSRR
jgi:hypothetical protein